MVRLKSWLYVSLIGCFTWEFYLPFESNTSTFKMISIIFPSERKHTSTLNRRFLVIKSISLSTKHLARQSSRNLFLCVPFPTRSWRWQNATASRKSANDSAMNSIGWGIKWRTTILCECPCAIGSNVAHFVMISCGDL